MVDKVEVRFHNPRTGKTRSLPVPEIRGAAFSPLGTAIAVATVNDVHLLDAETGDERWQVDLGADRSRLQLSWSRDGEIIVVSRSSYVWLIDAKTGETRKRLQMGLTGGRVLFDDRLVLGRRIGDLLVFDRDGWQQVDKATVASGIDDVAASPDGTQLAIGTISDGVLLVDAKTLEVTRRLATEIDASVSIVHWEHPDLLSLEVDDGSCLLWRVSTDERDAVVECGVPGTIVADNEGVLVSVAGSPAHQWIRGGADGREGYRTREGISNLDVSPDGHFLAAGTGTGLTEVWDLRTHRKVAEVQTGVNAPAALTFHGDWLYVLAGSEGMYKVSVGDWEVEKVLSMPGMEFAGLVQRPDSTWTVIRFDREDALATPLVSLDADAGNPQVLETDGRPVTMLQDGVDGAVITVDEHGLVVVEAHGKELFRKQIPTHIPLPLAVHPNKPVLVTVDPNTKQVVGWDWTTGAELRSAADSYEALAGTLVFSPSGARLALGDWTGGVVVFDTHDLSIRSTLSGHDHRVSAMAFASEDRLLTGSWDRSVRRWDLSHLDVPAAELAAEFEARTGRTIRGADIGW